MPLPRPCQSIPAQKICVPCFHTAKGSAVFPSHFKQVQKKVVAADERTRIGASHFFGQRLQIGFAAGWPRGIRHAQGRPCAHPAAFWLKPLQKLQQKAGNVLHIQWLRNEEKIPCIQSRPCRLPLPAVRKMMNLCGVPLLLKALAECLKDQRGIAFGLRARRSHCTSRVPSIGSDTPHPLPPRTQGPICRACRNVEHGASARPLSSNT